MPRMQLRCQQAERRDYRKLDIVTHCDQLRCTFRIYFRDCAVIARIDFGDVRGFVNNLRLVIAHFFNLVRDLVEVCLPDDYSN